jgi:hypothetical protein
MGGWDGLVYLASLPPCLCVRVPLPFPSFPVAPRGRMCTSAQRPPRWHTRTRTRARPLPVPASSVRMVMRLGDLQQSPAVNEHVLRELFNAALAPMVPNPDVSRARSYPCHHLPSPLIWICPASRACRPCRRWWPRTCPTRAALLSSSCAPLSWPRVGAGNQVAVALLVALAHPCCCAAAMALDKFDLFGRPMNVGRPKGRVSLLQHSIAQPSHCRT